MPQNRPLAAFQAHHGSNGARTRPEKNKITFHYCELPKNKVYYGAVKGRIPVMQTGTLFWFCRVARTSMNPAPCG
jgi:hypothetical protein